MYRELPPAYLWQTAIYIKDDVHLVAIVFHHSLAGVRTTAFDLPKWRQPTVCCQHTCFESNGPTIHPVLQCLATQFQRTAANIQPACHTDNYINLQKLPSLKNLHRSKLSLMSMFSSHIEGIERNRARESQLGDTNRCATGHPSDGQRYLSPQINSALTMRVRKSQLVLPSFEISARSRNDIRLQRHTTFKAKPPTRARP